MIYLLLALILVSVVFALVRLVDTLPRYAPAFQQILGSALGVADRLGFGQQQIGSWRRRFSPARWPAQPG